MTADDSYTEPPARLLKDGLGGMEAIGAGAHELPPVAALLEQLREVEAPEPDADGDVEHLGAVAVTHRFIDAPGDSETVRWHLVEAGERSAPTVVFLHGVPDSWWEWHHVIEALGDTHHCIAVDLKGYGQSDKRTGDYRQSGVATQLIALFDELGLGEFSLITHDRGTPPADHIVATLGDRVTRYGRGQQHLWHLNPMLHPQEAMFTSPAAHQILSDAAGFVSTAYALLTEREVAIDDLRRTVQEFSYPGIAAAVPRYFNSSSFRQEWIDRRHSLIDQWRCPVMLLQGADDPLQPREFYVDPDVLRRLPDGSGVHLFDAGHFWTFEAVEETVEVITEFVGNP
ncbi:alpha/beta hydrolase [Mycobacterium sp. 21AC1]|uniref:alpha/beta fold hydrolase n=1 Tax=[Mycobacterium] appelbergii TaxID=2939269 RepID=UPI0029394932|nr:alpha/beta fold hydrolase [Mycobacterium sp. 21AC1]MDV3129952.1 alpha/beta hydrolase [Mycobacterium sp. 21AC1]